MRSGPRLHVVLASVVAIGCSRWHRRPHGRGRLGRRSAQRVEQIADQLEALENQIGQLDEEYAGAHDRMDELTAEIAVSQAKVDAQQAELGLLQGQLASIAVDKFTSGGLGATPLLGSAAAVTDELQRDELSRVALDQGAGHHRRDGALVDDLTPRPRRSTKKAEQAQLIASLEPQQQAGEALDDQYEQRVRRGEGELGDLIVEEQERRAAQPSPRRRRASSRTRRRAGRHAVTRWRATPRRAGSPADACGDDGSVAMPAAVRRWRRQRHARPAGGGAARARCPAAVVGRGIAVGAASGQLGVPYRFAAESPGVAFDCSGLTKYAWGEAGVYLPHQSASQYASTPHVPKDQVQPGDLIFYYSPIGHVGIYIGGGSMIHAPRRATSSRSRPSTGARSSASPGRADPGYGEPSCRRRTLQHRCRPSQVIPPASIGSESPTGSPSTSTVRSRRSSSSSSPAAAPT